MAIDPNFGVNDFKCAKTFSETETLKNNILTLLFMRPGSYPSLPHLGIHIQDYLYQFFDDIDTDGLTSMIAAQCQEFLPAVQEGSLSVRKTHTSDNKPVLLIVIPAVIDDSVTGLGIALTADENGNVSYNSMIDNSFLT